MKIFLRTILSTALAIGISVRAGAATANNIQIKQWNPSGTALVNRDFAPASGTTFTTASGFLAALGGTSSAVVDGYFADPSTNASFLPANWRTDLSLGGAALLDVGTTAGTVAAGDDSRITGAASAASVNGYFADPSTNGSFAPSIWLSDLGLGSGSSPSFLGLTSSTSLTLTAPSGVVMNTHAATYAGQQSGNFLLREWNAAISKIQLGGTTPVVIAMVGDSWMVAQHISSVLTSFLQTRYGNAGAGYVPINQTISAGTIAGTSESRLGTWTDEGTGTATAAGLAWSKSSDIATPGSWAVTATVTDFVLHYTKQSGGGSFRWRVDSGSWTTVDTSNATNEFATVSSGTISGASHTFTIEVTIAGSSGVIINGIDCQYNGAGGVRVHNLGASGSTAANWATVTQTPWRAAIAALDPDVISVMLGVNDMIANVVPATYAASMGTIVTNSQTAQPYADVVLATPSDIGVVSTYTMGDYVSALRTQAMTSATPFLDNYGLMGSYADADARSLMNDTAHPNAAGGNVIAANFADFLAKNEQPTFNSFYGPILAKSDVASTTKDTGAIVIETGGLGVEGAINVGGNLTVGQGTTGVHQHLVKSTTGSYITVQSNTSTQQGLAYQTSAGNVFTMYQTGDVAQNLELSAYDDSGVLIDKPITVVRASGGNTTFSRPGIFSGNLTIGNSASAATQHLIKGVSGSYITLQNPTIVQQGVAFQHSGGNLWSLYQIATTGDMELAAYDNSGVLIDKPMSIVRAASGNMTISRPLYTAANLTVGQGATGTIQQQIKGTTGAYLSLYNPTTVQQGIALQNINGNIWTLYQVAAGGNLELGAYSDTTGTLIDKPIIINRASGGTIALARTLALVSASSPTTSAAGQIAFDNDAWAASRGAIQVHDGTASAYLVATSASDTPTNGQIPTWNTGGTVTWETKNASTVTALRTGTAVLVGGTVTVADAATTTSTRFRISYNTPGGTPGAVYISAVTASTSFTITSTSGSDTSTVYYEAFEP